METYHTTKTRTVAGNCWRLSVVDSGIMPGEKTVRAEFLHDGRWHPGTVVADGAEDSRGPYGLPAAVANAFRREMPELGALLGRPDEFQPSFDVVTIAEHTQRAADLEAWHAEMTRQRAERARQEAAQLIESRQLAGDLFPAT